jgi:hypothetical protein
VVPFFAFVQTIVLTHKLKKGDTARKSTKVFSLFLQLCMALKDYMQPVSSTVSTKRTKPAAFPVMLDEGAAIALAEEAQRTGNDQLTVKLLQELLAQPTKPTQKRHVVSLLSKSFRVLKDWNSALPCSLQCVQWARDAESQLLSLAVALEQLASVYMGQHDTVRARAAVTEALSVMQQLDMQRDAQCGSMLLVLGAVEYREDHYGEALAASERGGGCARGLLRPAHGLVPADPGSRSGRCKGSSACSGAATAVGGTAASGPATGCRGRRVAQGG